MIVATGQITITEVYDGDSFYRAWANSPDGSANFSTTDSDRDYFGVYTGLTDPGDDYTKYKWTKIKGASAITAILTNDSHQLGTDEFGEKVNYHGAETTLVILEGGTDITDKYKVKIKTTPEGDITGSLVDTTYTVTGMDTDNGEVIFTATPLSGTSAPLTKIFTISKNRQGISGEGSKNYYLSVNDTVVKKDNMLGIMEPETVEITGSSMDGEGDYRLEPGYFKVYQKSETAIYRDEYEQAFYDGLLDPQEAYAISYENYPHILTYTSKQAETTLEYTIEDLSDVMSVNVYWYLDDEFTKLLDVQSIAIISDGLQPVMPIIQAPHGKVIYNRDGYITLELALLRGTEEVTPDWIRWYQINPMSLGDEYSSSGWSFLNETNKELILDEGRIHDTNTILVVAEFEGHIYRATQQVADITDPLDVEVLGPTVFKNGRGSVDLFAKLYKNGLEIDKLGKAYGYSWYGYDNFGNLVDGFHKFGKQVTFTRDEVDNIVNVSLMASENIATVDKLIPNGAGVSKKDSRFTVNPVNGSNGVRINSEIFDKGITYKLEFTLEELTGGISGLGGSTTGFEPLKVRVNGKFYPITSWELGTIDLSDEGFDEHFIELWLNSQGGSELRIQPGLGSVVQGTEVRLTDIGVMRGAQEPSDEHNNTWEPIKDMTWLANRDKTWLELL